MPVLLKGLLFFIGIGTLFLTLWIWTFFPLQKILLWRLLAVWDPFLIYCLILMFLKLPFLGLSWAFLGGLFLDYAAIQDIQGMSLVYLVSVYTAHHLRNWIIQNRLLGFLSGIVLLSIVYRFTWYYLNAFSLRLALIHTFSFPLSFWIFLLGNILCLGLSLGNLKNRRAYGSFQ